MNGEEFKNDRECPEENLIEISEDIPEEYGDSSVEKQGDSKAEEKAPRKLREKGSIIFTLLIAVFCMIIFGIGGANIIAEDREFSDTENRVLSKMPGLTFNSLADGSFSDDFEAYFTDQFILRDEIIALKTFFERVTGKKKAGGVYIGKDGYLFSEQTEFDDKSVTEIADALHDFAMKNEDSTVTFMLSPNSSYVNADKLPENLRFLDQSFLIMDVESYTDSENILWLNLSDTFREYEKRDSLFYKTDHHWTTRAAYLAFKELMPLWGKDTGKTKFKFLTVADDFRGTLSSKSGVLTVSDTVEICVPKKDGHSYIVSIDGQEEKRATLFDESKLSEKNKYEVFLGGNYGKVTIDTTSESKDTLLIIKDSYANCMIPMLTPFFARIVIIDPRYFSDSLRETVEENTFTHMLFLYNLNTLLEDRDLADCLVS